jgi:hypothetical protein
MKKILLILATFCSSALASETIRIQTPYTASHSGTPAMFRILERANAIQKEFVFVLEFKPGANQVLAIKQLDQDPQKNLAIVAASFVDNVEQGLISAQNYSPIWSLGDACWVVLSTVARSSSIFGLRDQKEITVGTVGFGNATHLSALQIAKKLKFQVRLVPFKSNNDAVVNMVGNNGVTFTMDIPSTYEAFKNKNKGLKILAVSCSKRLPDYPDTKTLTEQGITAPSVINIVVAHVDMPVDKQQRLGQILSQATADIGEPEILKLSGFIPPQFYNQSAQEHFTKSMTLIGDLRKEFAKEIKGAQ